MLIFQDDKQLLQGLKDKNEVAFKNLVDLYQEFILNICFHFLNNREDAEDIAQDVFIEVFHSAKHFRGDSRLSTWMYRIAVNKSLNYLRSKKKYSWIERLENMITPGENLRVEADKSYEGDFHLEHKQQNKILYSAINELPDNQRTAFTFHKFENLPHKEISEIMDISVSAVESLIHRAKFNLQKKLYRYFKK
jgi:RNA polymerase sigma-70 factor, ECF subfamily